MRQFSRKYQELIELYTKMAVNGYKRDDETFVANAFADMEIRAFKKHVQKLFNQFDIRTLLDYGCGGSDYFAEGFDERLNAIEYFELQKIRLYEPARNIDEREISDAVVCFDVLEHVFISDIPTIIRELFSLTSKLLVVNVACYTAAALLPNGENAHITVRPPLWWKGMFDSIASEFPEVRVQLWCSTAWRKVEEFPIFSGRQWLEQNNYAVGL